MTWAERLERAAIAGRFIDEDHDKAGYTGTCAVGETISRLMPWSSRERVAWAYEHAAIYEAGMQFTEAVAVDDVASAAALYHWIETEMAAELGREL